MSLVHKTTGYYKSFDDCEIYFEDRGQGEPIVFCYGIGCLFNHWHPQIKYFSKTNRVILFDYRGHNKSAIPKNYENMTVDGISGDLQYLLKHLGIEKAHFVGHSFAAQVLVNSYKKHPEIFKSITFVNGFVTNPLEDMFGSELPHKAFESIRFIHNLMPDTVETVWKKALHNPVSGTLSAIAGGFNLSLTSFKDIEIYTKGISHMDLKAFLLLFEDMIDFDGTSTLSEIKVPTLIIGGKKDNVTPPEHQVKMHHEIKGSELSLMAYGSHCTQLDLPEYLNIRIEKFLNDIK